MTAVLLAHRVEERIPHQVGPFEKNTISLADFDDVLSHSAFRFAVHPNRLFESPKRGGVLLTFDDGYAKDVHRWLRLIEKHEVHAVLFVTTGFVDGHYSPYEETLGEMLALRGSFKLQAGSAPVDVGDFAKKQKQYEAIRLRLGNLPTVERHQRLRELAWINQIELPNAKPGNFLSWEQITELDRHPLITIGAHTESHPKLTCLGPVDVHAEVVRSKQRLEEQLGHEVSLFSYPYGANNRITRRIVKQAGFRIGFGTRPGRVWKFTPRRRVPRIDIKSFVAKGREDVRSDRYARI